MAAGPTLDDLTSDVTALSSLDDSIITLLNNVSSAFAAAANDPPKILAIDAMVKQNIAKLQAAIVANTPAAPAAPVAPASPAAPAAPST